MTLEKFCEIETEVKRIIGNSFCKAIEKNSSDFILLMARGGYHKHLDKTDIDLSPFVIEDRQDFLMDITRKKFFIRYLNDYVERLKRNDSLSDEDYKYLLNIQLMVYTHIWESHLFLNQLERLTLIQLGKGYLWKSKIPTIGKGSYINSNIINRFERSDVGMARLIKLCYSKDLRNDFAHSTYYIEGNRIQSNKYALFVGPSMSFEQWDEMFVRSMLLSYHLNDMLLEIKNGFIDENGDSPVVIDLPMKYHHDKRRSVHIKPERIDGKEEKVRFRFLLKEEFVRSE